MKSLLCTLIFPIWQKGSGGAVFFLPFLDCCFPLVFRFGLLLLRELISIRKLKKLGDLRQDGEQVLLGNGKAKPVVNRLYALYSARPDMHWYLEQLHASRDEIMDEPDRILIAEKTLLAPLDAEAKQIIGSAAKRISVITALNPSAVLDVLFVGYQVTFSCHRWIGNFRYNSSASSWQRPCRYFIAQAGRGNGKRYNGNPYWYRGHRPVQTAAI